MQLAADAIRSTLGPLLDALPDGVLMVNEDQRIVFANQASERIFGHSRESLFGQRMDVLIPPRVRKVHTHAVAAFARDGRSERGHELASLSAVHADGHEFPVEIALSRALAFGPALVMALVRDQSDRAKSARVLEERTEQFRLVAEASHDALYTWTPDGQTQWIGDGLTRFLGYPPLVNTDSAWWVERLHPDDRERVQSSVTEYMTSPACVWSMEYRFRGADDRYSVLLNRSIATRAPDGRIEQVFGALMDISELRASQAAERALVDSESRLTQRLQLIVESMPAACIASDEDGVISYVNPAATMLFATDEASLLGRRWPHDFLRAEEGAAERSANVSHSSPTPITLELRAPSGRLLVVECTSARMANPSGGDGVISMLQDLTANRALQQQVMQSQKMEALGRVAGGVAHDFNNLLAAILASSDLLLDALGPQDPRREDAEEIHRTAVRATNLTRQLLALSRRESGALRTICLNDVVHNMERLLRRLLGDRHHVAVTPCDERLFALIDPTRFEQVIINLAVNARDAMPDGGALEIRLSAESGDAGSHPHGAQHAPSWACVTVNDTGPGIPRDVIEHIFEPFFTTKDAAHGTGLGLSICLAIAHEAGGTLDVSSDPHRGTSFSLRLPLTAAPLAA